MDSTSALILAISLIIIMLGMGLSLVPDDFRRIFVNPKAIITGLINQLILLPLIGFALALVFPVSPEVAVGIIILAACPGGPTSNLIAHLAKGDTALSVSLTAASSLITVITIPIIVNLGLVVFAGEGTVVKLNVVQTIVQIFVIAILPVIIGMLIRHYKEAFALRMDKPVKIASAIVLALVIIGVVIKDKDNMGRYFQQAGLIALALNVATMAVGYFTAKVMKLNIKQAVSISIESGIQNGTMAITIAIVLLGNAEYAFAPAVYSLIMFGTAGAFIYWSLKRIKE
ncbi:MAG: bile acid:sodium symporter family protein [Bacteroidota bacterium]